MSTASGGGSRLTTLLACFSLIFSVSVKSQAQDCYSGFHFLKGSQPDLELLRDEPPTGNSPTTIDSPFLIKSRGNSYKVIGSWRVQVSSLESPCAVGWPPDDAVHLWLGLRSGGGQRASFDLRAELFNGSEPVQAGEVHCISGLTRDPSKAREVVIPFSSHFIGSEFTGETELSLRVSVRIGTDGDGVCQGHAGATGLRVYYDSINEPSAAYITMLQGLPPVRD